MKPTRNLINPDVTYGSQVYCVLFSYVFLCTVTWRNRCHWVWLLALSSFSLCACIVSTSNLPPWRYGSKKCSMHFLVPWEATLVSPTAFTALLTACRSSLATCVCMCACVSDYVSLWWASQVKLLCSKHADTEPWDSLNHRPDPLNNTNSYQILAHKAVLIILLKAGISTTILLKEGGTFCWEAVFQAK